MKDNYFYLLMGLIIVGLFYLFAPILTPFIAGGFLAYLGNPLVDRMQRHRIPRSLGTVIVFIIYAAVLIAFFGSLVPQTAKQIKMINQQMPVLIDYVQNTALPWINSHVDQLHIDSGTVTTFLQDHFTEGGKHATSVLGWLTSSSLGVVSFITTLVLTPVVGFYLMLDWDKFIGHVHNLIPSRYRKNLITISNECDKTLRAFLQGQLLVMLGLAVCYYIGLKIIGLKVAILVAVVAGVLNIVPYLGLTLGLVLACVATLLQFQSLHTLIWVGVTFGVAQLIEGMLLTPILIGNKVGLHPVLVIFAVFAGGLLMGFAGIMLALPIAAIVKVLLTHLTSAYKRSHYAD